MRGWTDEGERSACKRGPLSSQEEAMICSARREPQSALHAEKAILQPLVLSQFGGHARVNDLSATHDVRPITQR